MGIYETGHVHSVEMANHFSIILLLAVCALQVSIAVERAFVLAYAKKVEPGITGVMTLTYLT